MYRYVVVSRVHFPRACKSVSLNYVSITEVSISITHLRLLMMCLYICYNASISIPKSNTDLSLTVDLFLSLRQCFYLCDSVSISVTAITSVSISTTHLILITSLFLYHYLRYTPSIITSLFLSIYYLRYTPDS